MVSRGLGGERQLLPRTAGVRPNIEFSLAGAATGPRGERGERGSIGPRGEPAPAICGWRVDRAAYATVPLLSDGSEGAPLELRGLFKQFFDEVAPRR
jgi:hypothetical protein